MQLILMIMFYGEKNVCYCNRIDLQQIEPAHIDFCYKNTVQTNAIQIIFVICSKSIH